MQYGKLKKEKCWNECNKINHDIPSMNFIEMEKLKSIKKEQDLKIHRWLWYCWQAGIWGLTVASIIFRLRVASIFVTRVTRTKKQLQSDSRYSKKDMSRFSMVLITSWTTELRHFRSTSGFIGCWKFCFQKFLLHQKSRREISGGVFWPSTPSSGWSPQFWASCHVHDRYGSNC